MWLHVSDPSSSSRALIYWKINIFFIIVHSHFRENVVRRDIRGGGFTDHRPRRSRFLIFGNIIVLNEALSFITCNTPLSILLYFCYYKVFPIYLERHFWGFKKKKKKVYLSFEHKLLHWVRTRLNDTIHEAR